MKKNKNIFQCNKISILFIIIGVLFIISIVLIIKTMTKNQKNGNNMNSQEIVDKILNLSSYKTKINVQVNSNKNQNKYVDGIMTIIEENDNEVTECKYKRNALISRIIKDKNGQIKYSYVVDGSDSKKTITIIDKGETKKGEEVYENGKLVKFIDATNGLTSSVTYDKDGHMSEIKNSDGTVWSFKYDFDEKGNWVREIKYKNGKADRITERSILYY